MSDHTSGPWVLSLGGVAGNSWNGCRINDSNGCLIATLSRNADRPMHEKAANARLIAASPAMYDALKRIVRDWDGEPEDMQEAQEALAQADGQS